MDGGCPGARAFIVPGTTSHRNPLATRRPPIVKPLINSPQYPTTSGELSASTEARGWGMNADEGSMITRLPAPWRIVELPHGFAVEDATVKQIGVFYGRDPDSAEHTGIMTMDDARQMAPAWRQRFTGSMMGSTSCPATNSMQKPRARFQRA